MMVMIPKLTAVWLFLGIYLLATGLVAASVKEEGEEEGQRKLLFSGGDDDLETITQVAIDNDFTALVGALELAGFDDDLDCDGFFCQQYTVFAPTDNAFLAVDEEPLLSIISADVKTQYTEHLRGLLRYHITFGKTLAASIEDGGSISTAFNREKVNTSISSDGNVVLNDDDATVVQADVLASNGVIHAIDSLLIPSFVSNDIVDVAISKSNIFSTLVAAVVAAGLEDELRKSGPFTLLAPTDEAFKKLPEGTLDYLLDPNNVEELKDILLYHVSPGITRREELIGGDIARLDTLSKEGKEIFVDVLGVFHKFVKLNDDAYVKYFDILASNGIIHAISEVLIPPDPLPNIVDLAKSNDNFKTLSAALDKVPGLADRLRGPGPFTLFAPADEAFDKLPEGLLDDLLSNNTALKDVLKYHALNGETRLADLSDGNVPTLLTGSVIRVHIKRFWYWFFGVELNDDAKVATFDIDCSNGVVHVIDEVLIPPKPQPNILDIVKSNEDFSTLLTALETTGLDKTLSGTGSYTVFAPSNSAFDKLPDGKLEELLGDQAALKDILLYHVLDGETRLADISTGRVATLQGSEIRVLVRKFWFWFFGVVLNDTTKVTTFDVEAENGVIHIIDNVLVPP